MRDFDPEKRCGRWAFYLFLAALTFAAGHALFSAFNGASPVVSADRGGPLRVAVPSVQALDSGTRATEPARSDESSSAYAGPAAAAAATLPYAAPADAIDAAEPPTPAVAAALRANRPQINLRAGPGTQYSVLGRLGPDTVLRPTGRSDGDWIEVMAGSAPEHRGWVARIVIDGRR